MSVKTQAERLFALLRRKGMTTMEMLQTGVSVAPWKRLVEEKHKLRKGEKLVKSKNARGLTVYRVTKG